MTDICLLYEVLHKCRGEVGALVCNQPVHAAKEDIHFAIALFAESLSALADTTMNKR